MIKNIILFFIFLILPNFSLACDKEDFLKYVSAEKNRCIALQTIGEINKNKTKDNRHEKLIFCSNKFIPNVFLMVELGGIEPPTSCMPCKRSPI